MKVDAGTIVTLATPRSGVGVTGVGVSHEASSTAAQSIAQRQMVADFEPIICGAYGLCEWLATACAQPSAMRVADDDVF